MGRVPDTSTFSLQDVADAGVAGDSLLDFFANANPAGFDPAYEGSKDRLSNFRNYNNEPFYNVGDIILFNDDEKPLWTLSGDAGISGGELALPEFFTVKSSASTKVNVTDGTQNIHFEILLEPGIDPANTFISFGTHTDRINVGEVYDLTGTYNFVAPPQSVGVHTLLIRNDSTPDVIIQSITTSYTPYIKESLDAFDRLFNVQSAEKPILDTYIRAEVSSGNWAKFENVWFPQLIAGTAGTTCAITGVASSNFGAVRNRNGYELNGSSAYVNTNRSAGDWVDAVYNNNGMSVYVKRTDSTTASMCSFGSRNVSGVRNYVAWQTSGGGQWSYAGSGSNVSRSGSLANNTLYSFHVSSGGIIVSYINGGSSNTLGYTPNSSLNTFPWYIGALNNGNSAISYFDGVISYAAAYGNNMNQPAHNTAVQNLVTDLAAL